MASHYRQHPTPAPGNQASTSPLAFLDDPFRNLSSTFLFFSTILLASALTLRLMHHHYHRARTYSGTCPSCAKMWKSSDAATEPSPLPTAHNDRPGSSNSQWAWKNGGTPFPELRTADSSPMQEDSDPYSDWRVTASSTFYTPLTHNLNTALSHSFGEAYCDAHSSATSTNNNFTTTTAFLNPDLGSADLAKARREQSERCNQPTWPAALQKVVVGDVKDSLIAKRRRSTLKRRD
jgi:hypothetical protein